MMHTRRGMTLLEVLVAVAVLATGVVAVERLLARSVGAVATDAELTRAMLLGRCSRRPSWRPRKADTRRVTSRRTAKPASASSAT